MAFDEERIRDLLRLYADNQATKQQIREMLNLLRQREGDRELESFMMELRQERDSHTSVLPDECENIWDTIHQSAIQPVTSVKKMKWLRVAAAVTILISMGAFFLNPGAKSDKKNEIVKIEPVHKLENDVQPGGNKAILALSNGSQIVLDNAANGELAQQGNTKVIKLANGQLGYKKAGAQANEVLYNTMSTPRGGQYHLILADGSRVWLNALSSIRFPTDFIGKERTVEITGEAYFEITRDVSRPFRVLVNPGSVNRGLELTVLGTHFNINAYMDEPTVKTTLLEGSVKVSHGTSITTIKPGEQTQLSNNGVIKVIHDADVAGAVAWKEGRFEFTDAHLTAIMRQLMRWYDVDVEYRGKIPDRYFTADISRNKTLSGILKIFELSDIDFRLDGKNLIVTP